MCEIPTNVDARRISDSVHWSVIGRGRLITNGFECKNVFTPLLNIHVAPVFPQNRCDDYEIRFCCPKRKLIQLLVIYKEVSSVILIPKEKLVQPLPNPGTYLNSKNLFKRVSSDVAKLLKSWNGKHFASARDGEVLYCKYRNTV